jgi:hypothetical protein
MKRTTFLKVIIATLLLFDVTWQAAAPTMAQTAKQKLGYTIRTSTITGGDYQLTNLTCPASNVYSGGDYRLQSLTGSGNWGQCCCNFLPFVERH